MKTTTILGLVLLAGAAFLYYKKNNPAASDGGQGTSDGTNTGGTTGGGTGYSPSLDVKTQYSVILPGQATNQNVSQFTPVNLNLNG